MTENIDHERLTAIFGLNGIKKSRQVKIDHINNMTLSQNQFIADTLIEQYDILENVNGELYHCNITDLFLMTSKKLPMMYVNVIYQQPLRKVLLFRIYLFFTIESEIKDVQQLLTKHITGTFSLELHISDQKKEIDKDLGFYTNNIKMHKKLINFTKAEEMIEMINELVNEVNEKLKQQYQQELEFYKMPTNIISLKDYKFDDNDNDNDE